GCWRTLMRQSRSPKSGNILRCPWPTFTLPLTVLPGISVQPVTTQLLTDKAANFADLLSRLLNLREIRTEQLVNQDKLAQAWLAALVAGESAPPDVDALRRLARVLEIAEPDFTAAAVRHLVAIAEV
ncbi:MAG: hypothetical protein JJU15_20435, partial [Pararhodobacter sp.]|nr:hypothetical protein [Pararhodobacter sp.]